MKKDEKCLGCEHFVCYSNQYDIILKYSKWLEDLIYSITNFRDGELYMYYIKEVYLKQD